MKAKIACFLDVSSAMLACNAANANETLTIKWTNWKSQTVYLNKWSRQPSGACTFPSQIDAGQTATITVKPSDISATVRKLTLEYGFFQNFVEHSCQINVDVTKNSSGQCQAGTPYMTRPKGSPYCEVNLT